jgi:hypothetical protein
MPQRRKLDLKKIRVSLNTVCLHCGASIPPEESESRGFGAHEVPALRKGVRSEELTSKKMPRHLEAQTSAATFRIVRVGK